MKNEDSENGRALPVAQDNEVAYDATMSMARASILALLTIPVALLLFVLPYFWLRDGANNPRPTAGSLVWFFVLLLLGIVVHELLHAVGFVWAGKVPRTAVKFGFNWKALAPYAHSRQPMTASAYRISVALPGLLLGLVPGLLGSVFGSYLMVLWGAFMFMAAGGDWAVLWAVRRVPGATPVRDHPSRAGCEVLAAKE